MATQTFILPKTDRQRIADNLHAFVLSAMPGKELKVEVKAYRKTRTDAQLAALFGVAYPVLEDATGFTKDELHEAFCRRFFGTVSLDVMGQAIIRPRRTTTTDENGERDVIPRGDFSEFYAMVQQVGAEIGVYVPSPDPLHGNERFKR